MEGLSNFVDRSSRIDCFSSNGKGMGEGRPRAQEAERSIGRYTLSLQEAEFMAYDGRPDIQAMLLESYQEGVDTGNTLATVSGSTAEVPDQTQNTSPHTHPNGKPKMLSEATTLAERAAIMKHTV